MEKIIDEIRFAEGFNKGYLLFQYEIDIAQSFIDNEVVTYDDFSLGFSKGLRQAEQEKTFAGMKKLRDDTSEQNLDIER